MNTTVPPLPGLAQNLLGLYGFLLPVLLYVAWSTLALWDLGRRDDARGGAVWGWTLAVFGLPFVGALAYLLRGTRAVPRTLALAAVGGGIAVYAVVLLVGRALGGIA